MKTGWQFWIDRGGTFTDIVGMSPDGTLHTEKLLSENPAHYEDSAVEGMRRLLQLDDNSTFPADHIASIKMGTTVATNALLERRGAKTVLAITEGFADALVIGTQHRPKLFELNIVRPEMLYEFALEVPERLYADGRVETALDVETTKARLQDAYASGYRSVAIALVHADRHPMHEREVARIAKEIGFTQISASHDVIPLMKLINRGDTTVADAYLSPVLHRYVAQVTSQVDSAPLFFMQSNGGLVTASQFRGKDAILSGPAGGGVGMAETAKAVGIDKVIGFDMGGTSTDVSHYAGSYERTLDTTVAGIRVCTPMLDIRTVAAGGGSECIFDGLRFRVGPESAGAFPGPAAYRHGGPLTITDCNILLGRIQPHHFPAVFGQNGKEALDVDAVRHSFEKLAEEVSHSDLARLSIEELAEGFIALAIENMANAIKTISVQRGRDLAEYALASFGGAGGQHACRIADTLGIDRILIHPLAGVLSAYGIGLSTLRVLKQQTIALQLDQDHFRTISDAIKELANLAYNELKEQSAAPVPIEVTEYIHVRFEGSDTTIPVKMGPLKSIIERFEAAHKALFGFSLQDKPCIAESILVEAINTPDSSNPTKSDQDLPAAPSLPSEHVQMWAESRWQSTPVFPRSKIAREQVINGPAIIAESTGTTVLEPGWQGKVIDNGELLLSRNADRPDVVDLGTEADPIQIEVFNSLFMSIAEQMGAILQNTAHSVNIKERLDFSCAVFDLKGDLVANAPHMPVHLGSMGESVRAVLHAHGSSMKPGNMFITNAPYNGGTHLPDITAVAPVHDQSTGEHVFFVAARGHHADIGGLTPGSMPPNSQNIEEEGVIFDAIPLIQDGIFLEERIIEILEVGDYPSRNPHQNIADLRAQAAACTKGIEELHAMIAHYGLATVSAYTNHVKNNAEEAVRRAISSLNDGSFMASMDDGSEIHVTISVDHTARSATIDFSGTSQQRETNYNAPSAVARAAVLYVFRTLVQDDIPLNEGCLKPLTIILPAGCMLNPTYPAAVVAGNVETSQVVCDVLYGALGQLAASQGTMNNLTFGNSKHQYYETLCGGTGAGPNFNGTDAVHSHMTNSRLTDVEILEHRYPVLIEKFGIRQGSGGVGYYVGGNGAERRIRFLEPMSVSILSGRRATKPFGLAGGQSGKSGKTTVERQDGTIDCLTYSASTEVSPGDVVVLHTPGGGGFGNKQD